MAISTTFVANKKRLICWILKTSSSCHFTLSDIMDGLNRMIGVSSSSDASFHMDHVMRAESGQCCVFLPLCAPPCWSPRWPEGPSPQAGVAPAGTAEPLAREGGRNGWMDGGRRGLHRPGEHCQQPPTSPITLHTILPSYPLSLLTLPHIQTDSPPAVCVCICVCALVIYLHTGFSGGWTCQKKRETVHVCVFVVVSERFLVCTACVCVGV